MEEKNQSIAGAVVSMSERLVAIETKLDVLLMRDDDKEERIRALEQMVWKVIGASLVLAVIVPVAMKLIGF